MNFIQHFEVVITAVKDVIRAWFIRNFNHNFRIVYGCFRDMKECRNLCFTSYNVCTLIPPFFLRNFAHQKTERHRSIVVESKA